jgi:hypothetical protein
MRSLLALAALTVLAMGCKEATHEGKWPYENGGGGGEDAKAAGDDTGAQPDTAHPGPDTYQPGPDTKQAGPDTWDASDAEAVVDTPVHPPADTTQDALDTAAADTLARQSDSVDSTD